MAALIAFVGTKTAPLKGERTALTLNGFGKLKPDKAAPPVTVCTGTGLVSRAGMLSTTWPAAETPSVVDWTKRGGTVKPNPPEAMTSSLAETEVIVLMLSAKDEDKDRAALPPESISKPLLADEATPLLAGEEKLEAEATLPTAPPSRSV